MPALPRPVALIAPRLDTGPTAQVVQACAGVLAETGHYLAAGPWHEPAGLPRLHALAPAAVLCIGPADDPGLRAALASLEIPIVETWATPAGPLDSTVLYANIETGRLAARHFAEKSYARVACVSADTPWERERRQGFIETARSLGLELAADIVQPEACQPNDGRMAFLRLLATNTLFDAVFASSDLLAAGAVSEAHHRDLHVPQDVAVLGVSEDGSAAQWAPGLSTLTASAAELGRRAGLLLLERLAGDRGPGARVVLEAVLEARLST